MRAPLLALLLATPLAAQTQTIAPSALPPEQWRQLFEAAGTTSLEVRAHSARIPRALLDSTPATLEQLRDTFDRLRERAADNSALLAASGVTRVFLARRVDSYRAALGVLEAAKFFLGETQAQQAAELLRRALALNRFDMLAAAGLADLALLTRDTAMLAEAHAVLRRQGTGSSAIVLARVEVANARGDVGDAIALRNAAADDPLVYRGIAEAMLRSGRAEQGLTLYRYAVEHAGERERVRLLADIALLAGPTDSSRTGADEYAQWLALDTLQLRTLLTGFWEHRAALTGLSTAERLAEHYRRLAYVHERFYGWPPRAAQPPEEGQFVAPPGWERYPQMQVFDDRARIYIRHGEPLQALHPTGGYISWLYVFPSSGRTWLHLRGANSSWWLTGMPLDCAEQAEWREAMMAVDPRFYLVRAGCRRPGGGAITLSPAAVAMRTELREAARVGLTTQTHRAFDRTLPFYFDLFRLAGEQGRTDVVAALAVPARLLASDTTGGGRRHALHATLTLTDTITNVVSRVDTTITIAGGERTARDALVRFHVATSMVPSEHTVFRLSVRDALVNVNGMTYGGEFTIPGFTQPALQLSDLVLASPEEGGDWRRGETSLTLVPFQQFTNGEFTLYYEVYHVPRGAALQTSIRLERERSGIGALLGRQKVSEVVFAEEPMEEGSGMMARARRVRAEAGEGRYRITVTVRDPATGRTARRERRFTVPRVAPPPAPARIDSGPSSRNRRENP